MELGVFGLRGFESEELRVNLCRIPQVSMRIREAQKALEAVKIKDIDLMSYINSNEKFFTLSREFRSFIISIISLGVCDKHSASHPTPHQMLMNDNLELLVDYLNSEIFSEKKNPKLIEGFCRQLARKNVFARVPHKETNPISYGLFTSHARWISKEGAQYGLFFQFLTQAVRESQVTQITYYGSRNEELQSLQKLVADRWPNVRVTASVEQDQVLKLGLFEVHAS